MIGSGNKREEIVMALMATLFQMLANPRGKGKDRFGGELHIALVSARKHRGRHGGNGRTQKEDGMELSGFRSHGDKKPDHVRV